jgi:hypothetical protein
MIVLEVEKDFALKSKLCRKRKNLFSKNCSFIY